MIFEHVKRKYDGLTCLWAKNSEDDRIWRIIRVYDADFPQEEVRKVVLERKAAE